MFAVDLETMAITMHRGDTGSFKIHAERASGDAWTENDRLLFTVKDGQGDVVLQRFYRLDDQWDLGDGTVLVEFHNNDTDTWQNGQYSTELRYNIEPIWNGTVPTGRCVNALTAGVRMTDGAIVRTVLQSTMTIDDIYGEV